jgi:hypothetical protein
VVVEIKTMKDHLSIRLFGYRSAAFLLGTFGILPSFSAASVSMEW